MIARSILLLVVWVALQGELTFGNVLAGVLVVAVLSLLFPSDPAPAHRVHPIGVLRYLGRLLVDLVTSTWAVVVAVVRPTPERTTTEVIDVELSTPSRLVAFVVANSITLTPGTMTVEISSLADGTQVLGVHVLGEVDREAFLASMDALEQRVLRAFTPVDVNRSRGGAA